MSSLGKHGKPGWRRLLFAAGLTAALVAPLLALAQDGQFLQHPFESRELFWQRGAADAPFKETAHKLVGDTAKGGHQSELIQLDVQQGNYIHYVAPVGKAPVTDELTISVWVRANRPGIEVRARVVLPHERDPKNLDQPLTAVLRGDTYQTAGRWQRVELRRPVRSLKEQQQLLRAEFAAAGKPRDVTIADAYVDQVMLNVYAGPGLTQVWTDDLEVGPLVEQRKPQPIPTHTGREGDPPAPARSTAEIKLEREQLTVGDRKFFLRGIRHTGTPLKTLRDARFNTVWFDESVDSQTLDQAVGLGFWLVPMLASNDKQQPARPGEVAGQLTSNQLIGRRMSRFLRQDAVLFWDLGGGLASEEYTTVARTAQAVRAADPLRPMAADIWDGFQSYSRGIDQVMLGVHRWPLMTNLEMTQYRDWLTSRRLLAQPGTYSWTWVQTHLPDWFTALAYEKPATAGFTEPVGPQPEQIRLLTYTAIGSGARGLGFWSDRFLSDTTNGRDRLYQMALLNLELEMLAPMLVTAQSPSWVDTSLPQVKAAVMRTDKGVLCLPTWVGPGSQFVPGQAAAANLTVVVPQVPQATKALLVSPGEVRELKAERVANGTKITIPEFGLTAAVVFTGSLGRDGLMPQLQDQARKMAPLAAQWSHDLAKEEYAKVSKIYEELEAQGKQQPDGEALLEDCQRRIQLAGNHRRENDSRAAYLESQRALRPLRILMRAGWEQATKELDSPTASPYAVSYYTLPRHWKFREEVAKSRASANVLPEGDFEYAAGEASQWRVQDEPPLDEVTVSARRVEDEPHGGKQTLLLEVKAKDEKAKPLALERTFLAVHSPAVKLPAGTLVRISGWVRIPSAIAASVDGALLYDSAGGEPLALRLTGPIPRWRQFSLFRRVPASGSLQVTVALTGLGQVFFDDVRVEPLTTDTTVVDTGTN